MIGTAVSIVLGRAVSCSDAERLLPGQVTVFGAAASNSTIGRTLAVIDDGLLAKIARGWARVRVQVEPAGAATRRVHLAGDWPGNDWRAGVHTPRAPEPDGRHG